MVMNLLWITYYHKTDICIVIVRTRSMNTNSFINCFILGSVCRNINYNHRKHEDYFVVLNLSSDRNNGCELFTSDNQI